MLLLALLCLAAALYFFIKTLPLSDEKHREGRLFAEDEEKLRRYCRRVYLLSAVSVLFLLAALPELL